jgi:DNA-directed RNA polymerase specialized sigma24 family protein
MLYLNAYRSRLSETERQALHLVEIEKIPYREAADRLRIKYENFKMLICRARKKIASAIAGYVKLASETAVPRRRVTPA